MVSTWHMAGKSKPATPTVELHNNSRPTRRDPRSPLPTSPTEADVDAILGLMQEGWSLNRAAVLHYKRSPTNELERNLRKHPRIVEFRQMQLHAKKSKRWDAGTPTQWSRK